MASQIDNEDLGMKKSIGSHILRPKHETIFINGVMSYGESQRAWNTIKLKHEILKEFTQLYERRMKFRYKIVMHRSYEDLKKAVKELEKKGEVIPILMWFYQQN